MSEDVNKKLKKRNIKSMLYSRLYMFNTENRKLFNGRSYVSFGWCLVSIYICIGIWHDIDNKENYLRKKSMLFKKNRDLFIDWRSYILNAQWIVFCAYSEREKVYNESERKILQRKWTWTKGVELRMTTGKEDFYIGIKFSFNW